MAGHRRTYPHKCTRCTHEWCGPTALPRKCPNCSTSHWSNEALQYWKKNGVHHHITREDEVLIRSLHAEGMCDSTIARQVKKYHRVSIMRFRVREGLKKNPPDASIIAAKSRAMRRTYHRHIRTGNWLSLVNGARAAALGYPGLPLLSAVILYIFRLARARGVESLETPDIIHLSNALCQARNYGKRTYLRHTYLYHLRCLREKKLIEKLPIITPSDETYDFHAPRWTYKVVGGEERAVVGVNGHVGPEVLEEEGRKKTVKTAKADGYARQTHAGAWREEDEEQADWQENEYSS